MFSFFWKIAFTKQYAFYAGPDTVHQVLPWYQVLAGALHNYGTIAFWDPFEFFGQPLIGAMQPGVLSPFTFPLIAAPLDHGHINLQFFSIWFVLIHYCAALFAYLFFRDLRLSRPASITGGMFYTLAGFVGTTEYPYMLAGAIWAPLVFMFLLRSMRGARPLASAAYAGLFLGFSWLSGHHQSPFYLSLAAVSVPLFLICSRRGMRMQIAFRTGLFVLVTGLIALVQVLAAAEYGRLALRWTMNGPLAWNQKVRFPEHEFFSLLPKDLAHFIIPGASGVVDPFIGIVGAVLAVLAIFTFFHRMEVKLFATLGLAVILLSMARNDLFYGLLYIFVPVIEKAREPIRMLSVAQLCIAVLVAFGAQAFLERTRISLLERAARWTAIFGAATFGLWYLIQFLKPTVISMAVDGDDRPIMTGLVALLLAGLFLAYARGSISRRAAALCLTLLMMIELGNGAGYYWAHKSDAKRWAGVAALSDGHEIADFLRRQPKPLRAAVDGDDLPVNFGDWYGIESVDAYLASLLTETFDLTWWPHRLASMYGVNYVATRKSPADLHEIVFTARNGMKVYKNPDAFPRAWAVHRLTQVKDGTAAATLVRDGTIDLRANAVLAETPPALETCTEPDRVGLAQESIQTVDFDVTMACRGLAVLSDSWYPGWRASVDGSSTKIFKVNSAIRGVVVEKGAHHVHFAYRPWWLYLGFAGTLMGIAIVIFLARRREEVGDDLFQK